MFIKARRSLLGVCFLLSLADGSTLFSEIILKEGETKKSDGCIVALAPSTEKVLQSTPYMLFLKSGSGFLTLELFEYIMDVFTEWWTTTRPGLHCFMKAIIWACTVMNTLLKTQGIWVFTCSMSCLDLLTGFRYMTRNRSRTFLKKAEGKFSILSLTPEERRTLLMELFCITELNAFSNEIVAKSFWRCGVISMESKKKFRNVWKKITQSFWPRWRLYHEPSHRVNKDTQIWRNN